MVRLTSIVHSCLVGAAASAVVSEQVDAKRPKKVAVLGTGLGAVTTAWYLSNYEGWQDDWDVTVYTLGFKMGGKGAAVRSMGYEGPRILEHGLHIFMGWYNNAFAWIQDMYDQWKPDADCPLQSWKDAFKLSCNAGIFLNRTDNKGKRPDFIPMGLPGSLVNITCGSIEDFEPATGPVSSPWALFKRFLRRLQPAYDHIREDFIALLESVDGMNELPEGVEQQLLLSRLENLQAHVKGATLPPPPSMGANAATEPTIADLAVAGERFACVGAAIAAGILKDGVLKHGFQVINEENTKDWVKRHGCNLPLAKNPILRLGGDLVFSYRNGWYDEEHFDAAAGTSLAGIMLVGHALPLRNGTEYFTDSTFVRMQAGMSETLITPAYEVLKRRGVKFNFFHKVEELLTNDGTSVDEIKMRVQATVKAGADKYNPFFKVKGLPVTPDLEVPSKCMVPACDDFFGQLEESDEIRARDLNLNSHYGGWVSGAKNISLKRGVDYDIVINGITAGLPLVSSDLTAKNAAFKSFIDTTALASTQSLQVWFYNTTNELGCGGGQAGCSGAPGDSGSEGTLTGGAEPFDTWADMTHLLSKEITNTTHMGGEPQSVQYFCSPQPFNTSSRNFEDSSVMDQAFEDVFNGAVDHLENHMKAIFPKAFKNGHTIYDWMVSPPGTEGRDRLRHQYWRSNADPSEHYVLSPAGSIKYRPAATGPGVLGDGNNSVIVGNAFSNMIIVGDIARTGIDSGCAEAAVTSGIMASYTLTSGRSPSTYTSWLSQLNRTDGMHLEGPKTMSNVGLSPVPTLVV